MGEPERELHYVFMNYDPDYNRLRQDRSREGLQLLNSYLSNKHRKLLSKLLPPNSYKKKTSLAIVDAFAVEITQQQAAILRSAEEVRLVDKNMELPRGSQ